MTRVLSFMHLEVLALKPYLKSFLLLLCFAVVFGAAQREPSAMTALLMVYVILFLSYPFVIGEKNGLDTLYATLSLSRNQVVAGIYLLTVATDIAVALVSLLLSRIMAIAFAMSFNWAESLFITSACFLVFSFIAALQLPIYFKLGYAKAKMIAFLPMMLLALPVFILPSLRKQDFFTSLSNNLGSWITENPAISCLLPLLAGSLFLLISGWISCRIYQQRDF